MTLFRFIILSTLLCLTTAIPVSYQYVSFVRNDKGKSEGPARRSRSFGFSTKTNVAETQFWSNGDLEPQVNVNSLNFEEHRGHITPDFSNGLEYPDPLLLRGHAAKRAAAFLYRKPLFFGEINHLDAMLKNQEQRRRNGLAGHKLGSLRPNLPFYRFKKDYYQYF